MAKVLEIAISQKFKGQMSSVASVNAIAGKGLVSDRHFKENNGKKLQVTFIEIESIENYNETFGTSILPKEFRRNIITQGIELNKLLNKEFFVGKVRLKAHDLCRPCKNLQESLKQKDLVKALLRKGGLRCEILNSGKISVGDKIET